MDLSNPARAVSPSLDLAVLVVLAGTSRPLTGREVHRLCGHSQRGVQEVLNRMSSHGLVDAVDAGSARLYTLNREHVAADAVILLSDLREQLFKRMRSHLRSWTVEPVAAAVFGSAARGDGGTESDIDVLVIRPDDVAHDDPSWTDAVDDLSLAIKRWTGNHASIIQATTSEVADMIDRDETIVEELASDAVSLTEVGVLDVHRQVLS